MKESVTICSATFHATVKHPHTAYFIAGFVAFALLAATWWLTRPRPVATDGPWTVEVLRRAPHLSAVGVSKPNPTKTRATWTLKTKPASRPGAFRAQVNPQFRNGFSVDSKFGHAVAGAGDVNGDGFEDLMVGAFSEGVGGVVYVYYGSEDGIGAKPAWTYRCPVAESDFGHQVAGVGDVNGDGYADFVVGATHYSGKARKTGAAFLFLGGKDGPSKEPAWSVEGTIEGDRLGFCVAAAGDVNGDGFDDVLIGAPGKSIGSGPTTGPAAGQAMLYAGGPTGLSTQPVWIGNGEMEQAKYGYCLHGAGDLNGDGYADVVIGSFGFYETYKDQGRAYVYFGGPDWLAKAADWTITGKEPALQIGASLGPAGDVNRDGMDDLLIAVDLSRPEKHEGAVLGFYGSKDGLAGKPSWVFESDQEQLGVGHSVYSVGDIDGDGFGDVILSAYYGEQAGPGEQTDEGLAFLFLGSAKGLNPQPDWTTRGRQAHGGFGSAVRGVGDLNGDGFPDFVIGHEDYSGPLQRQGRVWVHFGGRDRLPESSQWRPRREIDGYSTVSLQIHWPSRAKLMLMALIPLVGIFLGTRWYYLGRERHALAIQRARDQAQADERERISQDLHDQLGADLTHIAIATGTASRRLRSDAEAAAQLSGIEQDASRLVENLSEIVWLTKPAHDTLQHLASFLEDMTTQLLERAGIKCILDIPLDVPGVTVEYDLRHDVVLTVKEALHNAIKHSGASTVRLMMAAEEGRFKVLVSDDGRGFALATVSGGNGLGHMTNRLERHGGSVEITSGGDGTRVTISVPLPPGTLQAGREL